MIEIFAIRIIDTPDFNQKRELIASFLPEAISQKLLNFKNDLSMQRSMLGELLSRSVLSQKLSVATPDIEIIKGKQGKPYLNNNKLYFNVSHSGDWVVLATSDQEVGIDIERIRNVDFRIAERFFSKEEKAKLFALNGDQKTNYFLDLWTLKESYLKLLGKGLTKSLSTFTIKGENGNFQLSHDDQVEHEVYFQQYPVDAAYKLSVCTYSNEFNSKIQFLSIGELIHQ